MNRFRVTIILLFGGFMQIDLTDKPRPLDEKWLLFGTLLSNTGNSMIWPVTTLYMTGVLHQSFTMAGLVLIVGSLISMVGSLSLIHISEPTRRLMASRMPSSA